MATSLLGVIAPRKLDEDEVSPFGGVLQKAIANYDALTKAKYLRPQQEEAMKQMLANTLIKQNEARFAPEMSGADLRTKLLGNQTEEAKLPFIGPQAAATLGLTQQQGKWYGPKVQSEIARESQETKFLPLKYAIEAQNSSRASSRFGPTFEMARALSQMTPEARAAWIAQNQDAYTGLVTNLANSVNEPQQTMLTPDFMKKFGLGNTENNIPQQSNISQNVPTNISQNATPNNALANIAQNISAPIDPMKLKQGTELAINALKSSPEFKDATPEQHFQMEGALQMSANNKGITAAMRNRAESSVAMDKWLLDNQDKYAPDLARVAKYSGLTGRGKKGWDALQKTTPEAYESYKWFKGTFIPNLDNQIKQMEKMGATDAQREELTGMLLNSVDALDTDPKASIRLLNKTIKTMGDIGKSIRDTSEPIFKGAYKKMYGLKDIPENYISETSGIKKENITEENIQETMRTTGLNKQQVMDKLKERGLL